MAISQTHSTQQQYSKLPAIDANVARWTAVDSQIERGTEVDRFNPGICDSGVTNTDPDVTFCLSVYCCFEFNECTLDGSDVEGCLSCLQGDGEEFCYSAISCAYVYCGVE
jgi:hypothetical protein